MPRAASLEFGPFLLDLSREMLLRDGQPVPLRPKAYALLRYLAANPGRVVTKDELHAVIWPGVIVTDDSLTRLVSDVRAALQDSADGLLRTVPRRGYIFEAAAPSGSPPLATPSPMASARPRPFAVARRAAWAIGGAAALACAAMAAWWLRAPTLAPAAPMSLVVAPLRAPDPADGAAARAGTAIATELAAALTRWPGVRVALADTVPRLNTHMRLEGEIERHGDAWRVRTRLVEIATGATAWADDTQVAGGAEGTQRVVLRLATALATQLVRAAAARDAGTDAAALGPEALALRCQVRAMVAAGEGRPPAYEFCEQALRADPDNMRALVQLAYYLSARSVRGQSPDKAADLARAGELLQRAMAREPQHAAAHCAHAEWLLARELPHAAAASAERCLALNPLDSAARRTVAITAFYEAQPARILESTANVDALRGDDPQLSTLQLFRGFAFMMQRADDEALAWFRKAAATSPSSPNMVVTLAVQLALTGHAAEAKATMQHYLALPRTKVRTIDRWPAPPDPQNAAFVAFGRRFEEGLRLAGMPPS
jgi:DNA-binding winged helix-turn-helix (wHTH) protein/tetratricopeptide (TPR) repeat protein